MRELSLRYSPEVGKGYAVERPKLALDAFMHRLRSCAYSSQKEDQPLLASDKW